MKTTTKQKELIAKYDFGDYISDQIEYFKNDRQEFCVSILTDEDKPPKEVTDKQIEEHFYQDVFLEQVHFEDFDYDIQDEFEKHIGKEVYVMGENMTWRNLEGEKTFTLDKPIDIFREIAPETDLTFYIWKTNDNEYEIKISHHDSPMGEYYSLTIKDN
tara:strand:- start:2488 stop:2964 length:477 start_codon:yes stop_codon:yes gene_type:complete